MSSRYSFLYLIEERKIIYIPNATVSPRMKRMEMNGISWYLVPNRMKVVTPVLMNVPEVCLKTFLKALSFLLRNLRNNPMRIIKPAKTDTGI